MQIRKQTKDALSLILGTLIGVLAVALLLINLASTKTATAPIVQGIADDIISHPLPEAAAPLVEEAKPVEPPTSSKVVPEVQQESSAQTIHEEPATQHFTPNKAFIVTIVFAFLSIAIVGVAAFLIVKLIRRRSDAAGEGLDEEDGELEGELEYFDIDGDDLDESGNVGEEMQNEETEGIVEDGDFYDDSTEELAAQGDDGQVDDDCPRYNFDEFDYEDDD